MKNRRLTLRRRFSQVRAAGGRWTALMAVRFSGMIGAAQRPWRTENQIGPSYGIDPAEGYLPDWRRQDSDGFAR